MEDLRGDLINLFQKRRNKERLTIRLENLNNDISKTHSILEKLENQYFKEKKDVDKLKKTTLTSIFYKLKGGFDEKLSKETLEFLQAESVFLENKHYLESLKYSRDITLSELKDLSNLDTIYNNILNKLSNSINLFEEDKKQKIQETLNKIKNLSQEKVELVEAYNLGEKLLSTIDIALKELSSAQSWGIYDMLGGGFFSTMAKHNRMDEASIILKRLKVLLSNYKNELKDITVEISANLQLDSFTSFTDYFFDNFFTDSIIQNKINSAFDSIKRLKQKIISTQFDLNSRLNFTILSLDKENQNLEYLFTE